MNTTTLDSNQTRVLNRMHQSNAGAIHHDPELRWVFRSEIRASPSLAAKIIKERGIEFPKCSCTA
jgi:hypothetical protein